MILVDTSIWVDHFRENDAALAELLNAGRVLVHPFVLGEVALGQMKQRKIILSALSDLPRAAVATDEEVLNFVDRLALFGRRVGYVDVHLLAAVRLTPRAALWTKDGRLHALADELGLAMKGARHKTVQRPSRYVPT